MKNHKIFLLLIASIVLLAGCEANNADDTSTSAVDEQTHAEVNVSEYVFTTAETVNFAEKDATLETNPTTEVNTVITTETATEPTTSETLTEVESTLAQTSSEFSETTTTKTVTEATTTAMVEEKSGFYFEPEDGYAERFVDDLTGDHELFDHFSDALFIYREFYSGIGFNPNGIFENNGKVEGMYGYTHSGVAYSDYREFLLRYFTEDFVYELEDKNYGCINIDGELCYDYGGGRGGDIFFNGAELSITEQTDDLITLKLKIKFRDDSDPDSTITVRTESHRLYVVKTDDGWRFDDMNAIC